MTETDGHSDNTRLRKRIQDNCRSLRRTILILLVALCGYVGVVQIGENNQLSQQGEQQQRRTAYIPAKRGALLDRNGVVLNTSIPQYDIAIRLDLIRDPRDTRKTTLNKAQSAIADMAVFLGADYYLQRPPREALEAHIERNAPLPFVVWSNLSQEDIARFIANRGQFPYAELVQSWYRIYKEDDLAAQVRGYVRREAPDATTKNMMNFRDVHGAAGLEAMHNALLEGESGYQKLQTDVLSYRHETVDTQPAIAGRNLELTLDIALQRQAEQLIAQTNKPGAVVVMDATNGEILVMASVPHFHLPPRQEDAALPGAYVNRATAGFYPPGSTMKPLIALAALETGILKPDERIFCPGYYVLPGGKKIACTSKKGHGYLTVSQALAYSCNAFFCELGVRLGENGFDRIAQTPKYSLAFGKRTGVVPSSEEITGVLFSPAWVKNSRLTLPKWTPGDSANAAIGQGAWVVTPVQLAIYACAITTGKVFKPRLIRENTSALMQTVSWPDNVKNPVLNGMIDCVQLPGGTGRRIRKPGRAAYAKTGTAEHGKGLQPHAWMFAVAPVDKPKYVVVCVLEEGGHGGSDAAPVIAQLLDKLLP